MSRDVVIVGAGVIGLSTAYYASRNGDRVTILDRNPAPGDGCSYGNAGMITPSHFVPLAAPGMIRLAMKWMLDEESPFYVRPRIDPGLIAWGWKFHRAATRERVERAAPLIRDLSFASLSLFKDLAEECDNAFGLTETGMLMLCRTSHGVEEEARTAALAERLGIPVEVIDARRAAEIEPGIRLSVAGGAFYPKDAIFSPARFMDAMTRLLAGRGVRIVNGAEVKGWRTSGRRVVSIATREAEYSAEEYVICGGAWSPEVARRLGARIPIQAGKGYSVTLPAPAEKPSRGMILTEARVAITPMAEGLRIGGTMEISGLDQTANPARIRGIAKSVPQYLPGFSAAQIEAVAPWVGLRPCSPDGLPYVGRLPRWDNASVAAGHAMAGMSLGPITGQLMGEILSSGKPSFDISLLDPARYE